MSHSFTKKRISPTVPKMEQKLKKLYTQEEYNYFQRVALVQVLYKGAQHALRDVPNRQKKVRFASTKEMVPSPVPSSEQEMLKWYTQEEYNRFQRAAEAETQRLKSLLSTKARLAENDIFEAIGIEKFLSRHLQNELTVRKRAHFDAILQSQRYSNSKALARISEKGSDWARNKAQEFAAMYTELPSTRR